MSRPRAARRLDLRDVFVDGAPERHAADLEVKEVHGQFGFVGDANREVELLRLLVAFAAGMRRVVAAIAGHRLRHVEHFVRMLRSAALEARHQPPRAFFHRSRDELHHALALRGRGRTRLESHHHAPHLLGGDVRDRVDRDALLLEAREVLRERGPVGRGTILTATSSGRRAARPTSFRRSRRASHPAAPCSARCRRRPAASRSGYGGR